MKTGLIIIGLILVTMLLLGCTQDTITNELDEKEDTPDTNLTNETEVFEQEINTNWVNENEVIDVGSVI
ncbi:MAG: hypothetical protein PHY04_02445 [Candidatus ainarchaeum sp.]|jgi:hypothetical protein|nr:hypothetical protein [Candidatus ainarchaeum sp.]MDD3085848.1 hypothetical protein [Candidatus ainarchaeum sp.]MDD4128569.1 hypothetical protein [Candidatus ainarchaeum sp.]MDD4467839.1 hypothetical protein [Candidatus ainarchaeum sp.]